jgi:hypothetical protein
MYGYSPRQKKKPSSLPRIPTTTTTTWAALAQQSQPVHSPNNQVQPHMKDPRTEGFTEEDVSVIYRASYDPDRGLTTTHGPSEHTTGFRHLIHRPENSWMSDEANGATLSYPPLNDPEYASTIAPTDTSSMGPLSDHVDHITQQQSGSSMDLIRSISDMRKR